MVKNAADFRRLADDYTLIPVVREVFADLETPVSCFWKLARGPWSFLLESVEGGESWARYTFMGTEPRAVFRAKGHELHIERPDGSIETTSTTDPIGDMVRTMSCERVYHDPQLPRFVGGMVGCLNYDAVRWMESLPDDKRSKDTAEYCFLQTELTLVWDNLQHKAMLVFLAHVPNPESAETAWQLAQTRLDEAQDRLSAPLPTLPLANSKTTSPPKVTSNIEDDEFAQLVRSAKAFICAGDVIQVVLSRSFTQPTEGLHPFLVYRTLRTINPSPYMFYLHMRDTTLVGASPEALVRDTKGLVQTRPIAGTRPRGLTPSEDEAHAESLLADPKERAEHVMLVDLARNDIGRIAEIGSVRVTQQMRIEKYSHVMHIVSQVEGRKRSDIDASQLISATFPAGTLSGAPKVRAMEIIDELEPQQRGYYGGAVGFLGAEGNVDLCIAIRLAVARKDSFRVQAGAGIVHDSIPEAEAEETRNKARAVLRAIDTARRVFAKEKSE